MLGFAPHQIALAFGGLVILVAALSVLVHRLRPANPDRTGNGIAAGAIKTYDNRFLSIRLDELEESLKKLAAIDPQVLKLEPGALQGKVSSSVEVSAVVKQEPPKAAAEDKASKEGEQPKLAQSARERLEELINLEYEILGMRMILERSLDDRLWEEQARLQAVLGLQISLDPSSDCADSVAIVEVTFQGLSGKPLSVVALLPQERSSNMLFSNARSVQAAATAKSQETSLFWRNKSDSSSLVREPDTIAFQRPLEPGQPNNPQTAVTVGWQFRPPVDRPSVQPGVRQVFVILALPVADKKTTTDCVEVNATVSTYWRRYHRKTRTTSPRWGIVPWDLSEYRREESVQNVVVRFTERTQEDLKPVVTGIQTTLLGPGDVIVSVDGRNFFPGTTVAVGDKVHRDAASGLLIKSDHHMQITTTPQALAYGNGVINGRYGATVPLLLKPAVPDTWVAWCAVEPAPDGKFHSLEIQLASNSPTSVLTLARLADLPQPIINVDDHVLLPPYYINNHNIVSDELVNHQTELIDGKRVNGVSISAWVPAHWNPMSARFRLTFPFCGDGYQQAFGVSEVDPTFTISRWAREGSHSFLMSMTGGEFLTLTNWTIELDRAYTLDPRCPELLRLSAKQVLLTVPADRIEGCERLLIRHKEEDGGESIYSLEIPPEILPLKPAVPKCQIEISAKTNNFVKVSGTLLDSVGDVQIGKTPVRYLVSGDKSSLTVFIPSGQTAGFAELVVFDKSQNELGRLDVVVKD